MLSIGTKEYRNLQEQVGYNTECIIKIAKAVDDLNVVENVIKLEGDIEGYMYEGPASYFVFLYNGNDTYILSFSDTENSEHFNEDVVMDILETVYFS